MAGGRDKNTRGPKEIRYQGRTYQYTERLRLGDKTYFVLKVLAGSGHKRVLKAYDKRNHRLVLVRQSQDGTRREEDIIRKVSEVDLSCFPGLLDTYPEQRPQPDQDQFLIVQWIEGATLEEYLKRAPHNAKYRFPVYDAYRLILTLTRSVLHLHRRRAIHGDIKPANIVVRVPLRLALIDFGEAWLGWEARRHGPSRGTEYYCAPEQVTGQGVVDERADQYALATVLYEMITLKLPYEGAGSLVATLLPGDAPLPFCAEEDGIEKALGEVLCKALALSQEERYPTTRAFLNALEKARPPKGPEPDIRVPWWAELLNKAWGQVKNLRDKLRK